MTLRGRVLLASLASLALGVGALVVGGNLLFTRRVHAEASGLLRARVETQVAALTVTPTRIVAHQTSNDELLDREAWVFDGPRLIERPADATPETQRTALLLGRGARAAEASAPNDLLLRAEPLFAPGDRRARGAVVVALSVAPLERLQKEVLAGSLVVAALVLLAGGLVIRTALRRALRPIAEMAATAEDWGAHDLDQRFNLGGPRDELSGLAHTLDGLLARIAASRRHEQRFASEVAHELRTPLAGLSGQAELALSADGPEASAEHVSALESVVAQSRRLSTAIDALLAVARQELDPTAETVDVVAIAREFDGVEVRAPERVPPAEGEPEVVRRALAPLVDNARRFARTGVTLEIGERDGRVCVAVRDDGPGLDPELGDRAFDPGVRGSGGGGDDIGAGLGLPLARRLARSCGGDVVAGPGPGGCFVLELPRT